jgi:two-component system, cell cycle sensor histidine kinase and response regulator CckA
MLTVIIGYTELVLKTVGPSDPIHGDLKEILNAARRSSDITRQLLAFARKQAISPEVLDINEMIENMLKMLRRLIGENIELEWIPENGLWPVKMDPGQINQILTNLCLNARDAISEIGKITIWTKNMILEESWCSDHTDAVPGEYVLLAVTDTGCGMDRETVDHVFEPFFTTKDVGKGTGLGLAMVYGAVKQNNGLITIQSEPGSGTRFEIYLPRNADKKIGLAATDSIPSSTKGSETILVVEDEPAIMKLAVTILQNQGYTVFAAGSPKEAIRIAEAHYGSFHLLITDVIMPEMNGHALAKFLLSLHPGLKCLFISGYTDDVIARHGILDKGVHFIQKPFSMTDLSDKVRTVLDETDEIS